MLHGMQFRRVHDRFLIGRGHADVKGGDDLAAHPVFAGDVDSRLQFYMVNGEACDFFHEWTPFSMYFVYFSKKESQLQDLRFWKIFSIQE